MTPSSILEEIYHQTIVNLNHEWVEAPEILANILIVSRDIRNRACVRFLMACTLAKIDNEDVDIRKPYTSITGPGAYSGRRYDETYIEQFISRYDLPCNTTTAFLTPALRNINIVLTPDLDLSGRPANVYQAMLLLLDDVHKHRLSAYKLLHEIIRQLVLMRDETKQRMATLIGSLKASRSDMSLSSEQIINLIEQHLKTKSARASRLPVLIIAAAYVAARPYLKEKILPLKSHNAADSQTEALGDIEITLETDSNVVTCYEMKQKRVSKGDIDRAIHEKLTHTSHQVDNYIFVTTEDIEPSVAEYAETWYDQIGIEIVILDCIGFLRHFLHLFHRQRTTFLNSYQDLLLAEPNSAVSQPLKEVFLALRHAAESDPM
ncbi:MAG: restriction endonuclease, SacI family [Anaerolineae bacterium]|nr:restriction endonuclease, SacI family [Anaerolineae bacterium]MCA9894851.1 restriction endonuclease, SacI family [Anaerolineae bacterium]MCB9458127.1 restriction endonuclease, SacI family [Anaerolineaceae bacterium]